MKAARDSGSRSRSSSQSKNEVEVVIGVISWGLVHLRVSNFVMRSVLPGRCSGDEAKAMAVGALRHRGWGNGPIGGLGDPLADAPGLAVRTWSENASAPRETGLTLAARLFGAIPICAGWGPPER